MIALFADINGKRGRDHAEREHRKQDGLRAHRDFENLEKDSFLTQTPGFYQDFQQYATLCRKNRKMSLFA